MADTKVFANLLTWTWRPLAEPDGVTAVDYSTLLEHARYPLQCVNRTVARNRFNKLADSEEITVIMNHDRADEAVVMMRGTVLAALLDSVAEAAVKRASRARPLIARLEGLKPVPAGHEAVQVRYDTGREHHDWHVDESHVTSQ